MLVVLAAFVVMGVKLESVLEDGNDSTRIGDARSEVQGVQITENMPTTSQLNFPTDLEETFKVTKVIDGDTIEVDYYGTKEKVRMIGVDTPEAVDPLKTVECYAIEASNKTKEILTGQRVKLEFDDTQDLRDRYGRLLAYVILPGNWYYNLFLISEGYAFEYTYNIPYKYQEEFKQAEDEAREQQKGLWDPSVCNFSQY